jgi:hypothetical protein
MNGNFSNFRGHLIPIDPNTAAAATSGQYDQGSEDYRWRTLYSRKLDVSVTSTSALTVGVNTAGEYMLESSSATSLRIGDNGFYGVKNSPVTRDVTATAAVGGVAGGLYIYATTTGAYDVVGSTITISTVGRPVMVWLQPPVSTTATGSYIETYKYAEAGGSPIRADIYFKRDGVIVGNVPIVTLNNESNTRIPSCAFCIIDTPPKGTYTYSLANSAPTAGAATAQLTYNLVRLMALEI